MRRNDVQMKEIRKNLLNNYFRFFIVVIIFAFFCSQIVMAKEEALSINETYATLEVLVRGEGTQEVQQRKSVQDQIERIVMLEGACYSPKGIGFGVEFWTVEPEEKSLIFRLDSPIIGSDTGVAYSLGLINHDGSYHKSRYWFHQGVLLSFINKNTYLGIPFGIGDSSCSLEIIPFVGQEAVALVARLAIKGEIKETFSYIFRGFLSSSPLAIFSGH